MVYRVVNISVCTSFEHFYYLVYDYTPCFLPTSRRCCGPVDVAFMSGARVSGAHENMPVACSR